MILMIEEKQWSRLFRNVALVVLLLLVVNGLPGCAKTVVSMKEPDKAVVDPSLMVEPHDAKTQSGTVPLKKHLRQQAGGNKKRGDDNDRFRSLQGFVKDAQKPTPKE